MHDQVDKLDQLKANLVNMVKFVMQKNWNENCIISPLLRGRYRFCRNVR